MRGVLTSVRYCTIYIQFLIPSDKSKVLSWNLKMTRSCRSNWIWHNEPTNTWLVFAVAVEERFRNPPPSPPPPVLICYMEWFHVCYIYGGYFIYFICVAINLTEPPCKTVHFNANFSGMFALYLMCIVNLGCIKINITFSCAVHS